MRDTLAQRLRDCVSQPRCWIKPSKYAVLVALERALTPESLANERDTPAPCPCAPASANLGAGKSQRSKFAVLAFIPSPLTDLPARWRYLAGPPRTRLHAAYRFHARLPPVVVASLDEAPSLYQLVRMPHEGGALTSRAQISCLLVVPHPVRCPSPPRRRSSRCRSRVFSTSACVIVACPQHLEIPRLGAERKAALLSPRLYRSDRAPVLSSPASSRDEPLSSKTRRESSARYPASLSRCYALVFVYRISCAPCSGAVVSSRRRRGA
ncbi:hypothetical protein BJ912DRAFT_1077164 [Pholiota molesta]|nr:hypothetical protein BJ912DRAFT_1077164 [Pholiota molesta]